MADNTLQQELETYYRWFHQHPEPSYGEVETTTRIAAILADHGIEILDTGLKTGLVAKVTGQGRQAGAGHVVAVRGDIDALPIVENTGLPYASLNKGYLHGCGHDYNLTVALGAALLLNARREEFAGEVKVIFQPAEEVGATKETPTGAVTVLNTGALDDVEAYFGTHDTNIGEPGEVLISAGPDSGAVDKFRITIHGKGTHAARPNGGASPIRVAAALIEGIQSIAGQDVNPIHPRVVTVTNVEAGNTWNVVPDTAFLQGTARTSYPEDRTVIHDRLQALVQGISAAYGVTGDFTWEFGAPSVINDAEWAALATDTATELGLTVKPSKPALGGEDFSYYQAQAPGVFIHLGVGNADRPMHGPTFYAKTDAIAAGADLLATVAERALLRLGDDN